MRYLTNGSNQFDLEEAVAWEQLGGLGADGKPQEFEYDGYQPRPTPPSKPTSPAKPKPGGSFVDPSRKPKPAPKPAAAPGTEAGYGVERPYQPPVSSGITKAPTPSTKLPPSNCSNLLNQRCFLYEQHAARAEEAARVRKSGASQTAIVAANKAVADVAHQIAVLSAQMAGCSRAQVAGGQAACPSIARPPKAEVVDLPPIGTVVKLPPVTVVPVVQPVNTGVVFGPSSTIEMPIRLPEAMGPYVSVPPPAPLPVAVDPVTRQKQEQAALSEQLRALQARQAELIRQSRSSVGEEDRPTGESMYVENFIRKIKKAQESSKSDGTLFQEIRKKLSVAIEDGKIHMANSLSAFASDGTRDAARIPAELAFVAGEGAAKAAKEATDGLWNAVTKNLDFNNPAALSDSLVANLINIKREMASVKGTDAFEIAMRKAVASQVDKKHRSELESYALKAVLAAQNARHYAFTDHQRAQEAAQAVKAALVDFAQASGAAAREGFLAAVADSEAHQKMLAARVAKEFRKEVQASKAPSWFKNVFREVSASVADQPRIDRSRTPRPR